MTVCVLFWLFSSCSMWVLSWDVGSSSSIRDQTHDPLHWEPRALATGKKVKVLVPQLSLTLCDPLDCSPSSSSVHGILQARIWELVAVAFSRGSSWRRDRTWASCTAGGFLTVEPPSPRKAPEMTVCITDISTSHWLEGSFYKVVFIYPVPLLLKLPSLWVFFFPIFLQYFFKIAQKP